MMEWRDQVAVVTGGARGLGRATAWLLARRGAAVCVNYAAHGDAAEALIAVAADVAEVAAVEAMVGRTETELGPVTILVNNAGVSWQGTLDTYDREQVARMRKVNVDGVIHATRAVIGSMRAQRYGRIVNVASIAGIGTALSGNAFYAATKAEVVILTRRFALELGQHGITVNPVAPGFVRTDLTQRGRGAADWPGTEERFAARAMMGRIGEPEDGRLGTGQGNQLGLLLAVKNPSNGRHRARLAAQHGLEAFFHQLFAHPVNHGWACFQSFDDPVVAPPFASFRDIGLQQDPRLQYPARRALSFPNQGFKPFAFLAAQPHNIFLYRNLLRSHDCLPRQSLATKANH